MMKKKKKCFIIRLVNFVCVTYIHPSVKVGKVCGEGEKVQVWMQVEVRYSDISKILFDDPSKPMHIIIF
jgi:hypothetical protein